MALRIFVNDELNELHNGLAAARALLRPGGVCAAIAFSSLEDRIIKRTFQNKELDMRKNMSLRLHRKVKDRSKGCGAWQEVGRQPVVVSEDEVKKNPRSRSAKLRIAQKVA